MRYTTVIWEPPMPDDLAKLVKSQCEAKEADMNSRGIETTLTFLEEGTRQVAIRTWPDLASAEEWCAFVLGPTLHCKITSAVIDPET